MPKRPTEDALTPLEQRFVEEYLIDLNGTQAVRRAGYAVTTDYAARSRAHRLLGLKRVQEAVAVAMAARSQRTQITQDEVLQSLAAIARADTRELVEYRRLCCRHCYGEGFRYQRTAGEMERDRRAHRASLDAATNARQRERLGVFDEQGGIGFNPKRNPVPACPECFGDGVGEVFMHDTRRLSGAAAKLYAGVKQTREGLEVRTHSQVDTLVHVGRHLGMFKDKVEVTGKDGDHLIPRKKTDLTDEELAAIAAAGRGG